MQGNGFKSALRVILALAVIGAGSGCVSGDSTAETGPLRPEEANALLGWETFDAPRMAAAIFHATNQVRKAHGLRALRAYPRLLDAADLQADTNALIGVPSHFNPLAQRATVMDRVRAQGISPLAAWENVASMQLRGVEADERVRIEIGEDGSRRWVNRRTGEPFPWPSYAATAQRVVRQWMDSPAHRVNLLNREATHLGCGVALGRTALGAEVLHSTQVFIALRSTR